MQDTPTPTRAKSPAKRTAIVTAALRVFVREGYAASVDQVAAEAGVSKQTVYSHFGSKEKLFRACIEETKRDPWDDVAAAPDPASGLRLYARLAIERVCSADAIAFLRLLITQTASLPEAARIYDEAGPSKARQRLGAIMQQWIDAGRLRPGDTGRMVDDFLGLSVALRRHRLLLGLEPAPSPTEIEALADHAVEIFLRAWGPQQREP